MRVRLLIVAVLVAAGLVAAQQVNAAPACTKTWTGGSGNWSTLASWGGSLPGSGDVVCIPTGVTVTHSTGGDTIKTLLADGTLSMTGGTLTIAATSDPSRADGFTQSGGTIDGDAALQLTNGGTWSGGTIGGAGTTTVPAGKTLLLGTSTVSMRDTRVLDIAGTVQLDTPTQGIAWGGGTPQIVVEASGLLQKTKGSTTASATTSGINIPVENDGKVESTAALGILNLSDGSGGTSTGTYGSAGAAGLVSLSGSTHTLGDGAKLLDGAQVVQGATDVADGATATASNAAQTGGTIGGGGTLSITGPFTWSGGTMGGAGATNVAAAATVTMATSTVALKDTRVLDVSGSVLFATPTQGIAWGGGTPSIVVRATGLLRKTVGSSTASPTTSGVNIPVENDGKVESTAALGILNLSDGSAGTSTGTYGSASAAGLVSLTGSTHTLGNGAKLLDGAQVAQGATDVADGATVTASNAALTGGTLGGGGTFSITGPFTWSGGSMGGAGTTSVASGSTVTLPNATVSLKDTRVFDVAGNVLFATPTQGIAWGGGTPSIVVRATGLLRKTVGSSTASPTTSGVNIPVENDGKVESTAALGILNLSDGSEGTSTGTYGSSGAAGTVTLTGNTHTLGNGAKLLDGATIGGGNTTIPAAATVTATGARQSGGTLGGSGTLNVTGGTFTWSGGVMNGDGLTSVANGATMAVSSDVNLGGTRRLDVGGLLQIQGDFDIRSGFPEAPLHVLATGTLRKTAGTTDSFVDPAVENDGLVETTSGALHLTKGGGISSGTYNGLDATHHLTLEGDGHTLDGGEQLGDFTELAGDVAVAAGHTLVVPGEVYENRGTLTGDLQIDGTLHWLDGTHEGPGTTTVTSGGTIVLDEDCGGGTLDNGRRLVNNGLIAISNGSRLDDIGFDDTVSAIENAGTIRFDDDPADNCSTGMFGSGTLHNTGTVEKAGTTPAIDLDVPLDNDGTVRSDAGVLQLNGNEAAEQAGAFTSAGTGSYVFSTGVFALAPGATVTGKPVVGSGELRIPSGMTLDVPAGATLRQEDGTISGDGTLRVLGTLEVAGGEQDGGTTQIAPGGVANLVGADADNQVFLSLADSRALVNDGTLNVDNGILDAFDGASITNRGTMVLRNDSSLAGGGFGNGFSGLLHNTGTIRKQTASAVDAGLAIDNDGTIEITGGKLDVQELLNYSSDFVFGGPRGALVGGTYLLRGGKLGVPGDIDVIAARVVLGSASAIEAPGFPAVTDALAGLHRIAGGGSLELESGKTVSSGKGTGVFSNAGVLRLAAGTTFKAIEGYAQGSGGVLRTEVKAPAAAGRLTVTGAAALAGRLDVVDTAPATGTSTVASYGSKTGAFAATTGIANYTVQQGATAVTLVRKGAPFAPPLAPVGTRTAPEKGIVTETPAPAQPAVVAATSLTPAGPWAQRGTYLVARERGARLVRRGVRGRGLDIVAATGPRAGSVKVTWAGRSRTVSLRAARPGRRTIRVLRLSQRRKGTVVLRTRSARRVAIASLLVRP